MCQRQRICWSWSQLVVSHQMRVLALNMGPLQEKYEFLTMSHLSGPPHLIFGKDPSMNWSLLFQGGWLANEPPSSLSLCPFLQHWSADTCLTGSFFVDAPDPISDSHACAAKLHPLSHLLRPVLPPLDRITLQFRP